MTHFIRDQPNFNWREGATFGAGNIRGVSLIQSNYLTGSQANLELVAWVDNRAEHWMFNGTQWQRVTVIRPADVSGCPALIQSNWGTRGNFEVLLPIAAGGMASYYRNNDSATPAWTANGTVGSTRAVAAATLIQGQYGTKGNFEVAAILRDPAATGLTSASAGTIETLYRNDQGACGSRSVTSRHRSPVRRWSWASLGGSGKPASSASIRRCCGTGRS